MSPWRGAELFPEVFRKREEEGGEGGGERFPKNLGRDEGDSHHAHKRGIVKLNKREREKRGKPMKREKTKNKDRLYSTKNRDFHFSGYPLGNASPTTTLAIHQCLPPHPAF